MFVIKAGLDGVESVERMKGEGEDASGYTAAVKLYGTKDNADDTDEGYVIEISVPKKFFESSELNVYPKLYNVDGKKKFGADLFEGLKIAVASTWPVVRLSDVKAEVGEAPKIPVTEDVTSTDITGEPSTGDVTTPPGSDNSGAFTVIIAVAAGALVAIAVVVFVIVKKKRK